MKSHFRSPHSRDPSHRRSRRPRAHEARATNSRIETRIPRLSPAAVARAPNHQRERAHKWSAHRSLESQKRLEKLWVCPVGRQQVNTAGVEGRRRLTFDNGLIAVVISRPNGADRLYRGDENTRLDWACVPLARRSATRLGSRPSVASASPREARTSPRTLIAPHAQVGWLHGARFRRHGPLEQDSDRNAKALCNPNASFHRLRFDSRDEPRALSLFVPPQPRQRDPKSVGVREAPDRLGTSLRVPNSAS